MWPIFKSVTCMKIVYMGIRGLPPKYGGFERHVDQISRSIASFDNFDVSVVCEKTSDQKVDHSDYCGVKLLYYPLIPGHRWFSETLFDIFTFIRCSLIKDLDLIYYCGLSAGFFTFFPRLFGKKIVVNVDGFEWKNKKFNPILRGLLYINVLFLLIFPNKLITDNLSVYEYYKNKFKKNTNLIPYSVEIPEITASGRTKKILEKYGLKHQKYLLMITRIEKMNSVEYAIIESEIVYKKFGFPLVIVGDLSTNYAKYLIEKYGKADHIKFLGFISDLTELSSLRKNASIYVHGQATGGTSPALLEALAAGMIVASFDSISNRSTMKDTNYYFSYDYNYYLKNGSYRECSDNRNNSSLFEVISKILTEKDEALEQLSMYNIDTVMSEYGLNRIVKMHINLYNEICSKR